SSSPAPPRPSPRRSGCTGRRRYGRGWRAGRRCSPPRRWRECVSGGRSDPVLPYSRRSCWAAFWSRACSRCGASSAAGRPRARRQTQAGGTAVGTVLLDASPAAPDRDGAVSVAFERAHGVALRMFAPGTAPRDTDVFDFCPLGCTDSPPLFSVRPVPPAQGDAKLAALSATAHRAGLALAATLLFLLVAAPAGRWRWTVMLAAAWSLARAPLGPSLPLATLFSP